MNTMKLIRKQGHRAIVDIVVTVSSLAGPVT